MKNKFRLTMCASVIALTLSGCSSDDSEETTTPVTPVNSAPTLNIVGENSHSIDERESVVIKYNILDSDVSDTHTVSYEVTGIAESELKGSISLDSANNELVYNSVNLKEEENFSILLNVIDSAGNSASTDSASSRTVSISVKNAFNEAPELSLSGLDINEDGEAEVVLSPSNTEGLHILSIPYDISDEDGDDLELNVSNLSGITGTVELNEENSTIEVEVPEVYIESGTGSFVFSVFDGEELVEAKINVELNVTQVSPEIEISKNNSRPDGMIEIEYGATSHTINFNKSDKNGDIIFVTAALSEDVATLDAEVSGNTVNLSDILVEEDTIVTLTLTASDNTGTADVVDSVELSIKACTDCAYIIVEENKNLYLSQFSSISGRKDEATLFNFYTDYLSLTDQLTKSQIESHRTNLENNYLIDKNAIDSKILEVNVEFDKVEEDESLKEDKDFVEALTTKVEELKQLVLSYGESNIVLLNSFSQMDNKLPTLLLEQAIYEASSVEYSKYVGNGSYGYLINNLEWVFLTEYEVLEVINVLSAQCK